jgi:hypothetical protein
MSRFGISFPGGRKAREGKHFFFEKKKQKTFTSLLLQPERHGADGTPHHQ